MSFQTRKRRRAERFHQAVEEQLEEIGRLRTQLFQAQMDLTSYIDAPDWPERREAYDQFLAAGGEEKAHHWRRWVRGELSKPSQAPGLRLITVDGVVR